MVVKGQPEGQTVRVVRRLKVAVQVLLASIVRTPSEQSASIVTTPSEQSASPLQPVKNEPVSGVGVRVTDVPELYASVQSAPQSIPVGVLVTVPLPVSPFVIVRVDNSCLMAIV